jgi:ribosomal protein S18 acetylase RimI-like enzyme
MPSARLRRRFREGDLEAIVEAHARVYPRDYGVNGEFVAMVEASVARAAERGFPGKHEAIWIAELGGEFAGSVALTDEGDGTAMLRWVLLEPELRGRGFGRRMVAEAIAFARERGYERVRLFTFSDLTTAAAIYRSHGFEVIAADSGPRWGRDSVTFQSYELVLSSALEHGRTPVAAPIS